MVDVLSLPSLETIPEDIEAQLRHFLHYAPEQVSQQWLSDLIKNSGHLTTPEYLRWRIIALLWLAAEFDLETAWPYLMWFNMGEATMADHLKEIVSDGVEEMEGYVHLANWLAQAQDQRLVTFFSTYRNIPPPHKMASLLSRLLTRPADPAIGVWLAGFCRDTSDNPSPLMLAWHLLAATWYATCFDSAEGLALLQAKSQGQAALPPERVENLTKAARELQAVPTVMQWIAACPEPAVKKMLAEFGHPDVAALAGAILAAPADYDHLAGAVPQALADGQSFKANRARLSQVGVNPASGRLLDLACGPLAPQTLLFNSAGYQVTGADLHIPPRFLAPAGLGQRFKKWKHVRAWRKASAPYYAALAGQAGLTLTWKKARLELADLTRLPFPQRSFSAVICSGHLHHAPDVSALFSEVARVLTPGGVFVADFTPFAGPEGDLQQLGSAQLPWGHLSRSPGLSPGNFIFNKWRAGAYRAALAQYFVIEQWLTEPDEAALARLTPERRAALADYSEEELTCRQVSFTARKNI
jgi:SAM-dependent methyltransferase